MTDLEQTTITEQIKRVAAFRGYTVKALGEEFNRQCGTNYAQQSFSRKLNNQTLSWHELKVLGEILGFKVKLELVDAKDNA